MTPDATLPRDKRPTEEFRLSWDFVNDLETGDTLTGGTTTCAEAVSGTDTTSTMLEANAVSGTLLVVPVKAGSAGKLYDLTFVGTSAAGDSWKRVLRFGVVA